MAKNSTRTPAPKSSLQVVVDDPRDREGKFRIVGGSKSDVWNNEVLNQVWGSLWLKGADEVETTRRINAATAALVGIAPRDELEAMMAAQLLAGHHAAMECFRRAMIPDQPFEGRKEALNQANKLSRTWATLLESLNRHRGKGQQRVTVEHVHVNAGGQAVVGSLQTGGGGGDEKL